MKSGENICVVGLGYVGLTLSLSLCEIGFKVFGIEKNSYIREEISKKRPHFYEKGLSALLKKHVGKNLKVYDKIPDNSCNTYVITVGTPLSKDKKALLFDVEESVRLVAKVIKKKDLVIIRSTLLVGATREIIIPILEEVSGLKVTEDISCIYAPERTIEGAALKEIRTLPQVIGGIDQKSLKKGIEFFKFLTPVVISVSSVEAAEMIKIIDNTYRDLKFAIANEFALICESFNLNGLEVIKVANFGYKRNNIPMPSPGVGGPCLSKDPYFLIDGANGNDYAASLLKEARRINEYMPYHVASRIKQFFESQNKAKDNLKIFILGFGFKSTPLTSDTRESPTKYLIKYLRGVTENIYGFDIIVDRKIIQQMGVIPCAVEEGFKNADCVLFMLNNQSYKELNIVSLANLMRKPALIYDGWQIFPSQLFKNIKGIFYGGVGFGQDFDYRR